MMTSDSDSDRLWAGLCVVRGRREGEAAVA